MYILMIILLMFVFPIASVLMETFIFKSTIGTALLIGKWFAFWAVGIRLGLAGLRQIVSPKFTAQRIFGIKSAEPLVIVQELGFANLSIGILGITTVFNSAWITPAAIAGGLFYGLAGIGHLTRKRKNLLENSAMLSDLLMFIILAIYLIVIMAH